MTDPILDAIAVDQDFFGYLLGAHTDKLGELIADDFVMIAVGTGQEVSKSELLGFIDSGVLRFQSIVPSEVKVRHFGECAIVVGRTEMRVSLAGQTTALQSRYAHVYVRRGRTWSMVSAQGTPIVGS